MEDFSEEQWRRSFDSYVEVNRSHWTGPPFEFVQRKLGEGRYEFSVPGMGMWTTRFQLSIREGMVHAEIVVNPALPSHMKSYAEKMRLAFEEKLA